MKFKNLFVLAALALAMALPAHADMLERQQATSAALDALFSMEAVQPEGSERQDPPKGFTGAEASQDELIEFLASQKRRGANLNSYRHLGTPLHHAIRSGLHDVARWLLRNGAEPRLRVREDGVQGIYPGPDALGVAISVSAWDLVDELRRRPEYEALSADEQALTTWPYAMDSVDKMAMLLTKRIALPGFSTAPELASALLQRSLCTGQHRLAQALLNQADAPTIPPSVRRPGPPCLGVVESLLPANMKLPESEWKAIEARLQWPVLPFLAAQVPTDIEATHWLAAGLRSPWGEPVAATQYVWNAMLAPPPAALALLHAMPTEVLQVALHDEKLMAEWVTRAADWPQVDLRWALAQVDSKLLASQLGRVMERWSYAQATRRDAKDPKGQIARWALLTDRLVAPLSAGQSDGFPYRVPIELWSRWFELGYRMNDVHWADWILWADPAPFEQAWPTIARHLPDVAQRSLTWLVAPLSVGSTNDPEAKRLSYHGGYYNDEYFLRKMKFLDAQGVHLNTPTRWLAASYVGADKQPGEIPSVKFALAKSWVHMPPPAQRQQLERSPLGCKPSPSTTLRRSLASGSPLKSVDEEPFSIRIQPVAQPGAPDCAWLVSGSTPGGRQFIYDESFSAGVNRLTPCTEGNTSAALWNNELGVWLSVKDMPDGVLVPIRQKVGGASAFLSTGMDYGTCGHGPRGIFIAHATSDGGLELEGLTSGAPLFDALALQCAFENLEACLGFETEGRHPTDAVDLPTFVDEAWSKEKGEFLAAIDRLDRLALAQARDKDGIFAQWLDQALRRISASTSLSLYEKRKRVAWVLAQRAPRATFNPETIETLAPWLPAEDWGPILSAIRCNRYELERLAERTTALHLTALHRRIQSAMAAACDK